MSSNQLLLQLTYALLAFAAVMGSPNRYNNKDKIPDDGSSKSGLTIEDCSAEPLPDDIAFVYYTKQFPEGNILQLDGPPVPDLLMSTSTKIVTHGMRSNLSSPEMRDLFEAYLENEEDINVLALDWSSRTKGMYRVAAAETSKIGKMVASSLLCYLYKYYDIYPDQLHFIGNGLGAHLLATASRESGARVGRLTGLDPSRLCFEDNCHNLLFPALNKNDANFVDVLHTDSGKMGVAYAHGNADIYANYGTNQSLCHPVNKIPSPYCKSLSSIYYFASTIRKPFKHFASVCSKPYPVFNCDKEATQLWGEHMETSAAGIFNFIPEHISIL